MKIVIAGPKKSGKSTLVNLMSQQYQETGNNLAGRNSSDVTNKNYMATVGCRIVEMESFQNFEGDSSSVEFWDIAGDCTSDAVNCLPAIMNDADGIIFVYNPLDPLHCSEIELWHQLLHDVGGAIGRNYDDSSCLILMHYDTFDTAISTEEKPPSYLRKYCIQKSNYSTGSSEMRGFVSMFLDQLSPKK
jgi:GTPase SAR1 family protein